jgi:excisionase family DNA binding protein
MSHLEKMNKEEAANYIGASVRTLQRLTGAGKIPVSYERGHKGDEARYSQSDLDAYLQSQKPAALMRPDAGAGDGNGSASQAMSLVATHGAAGTAASAALIEAFAQIAAPVRVSEKFTLSLIEAAQLSGLSRGHLREAIEEKQLKARIIGRGFRVKRQDLEAYIRKL